jgi:hypothetical protein
MSTRLINGHRVQMTAQEIADRAAEIAAYVEPVPSEITKRQARQQLISMGMIDSVQPVIDAIADATERALVQSFWDDSSVYERNHPQMIALSAAIGMTEQQLDDAFIAASLR